MSNRDRYTVAGSRTYITAVALKIGGFGDESTVIPFHSCDLQPHSYLVYQWWSSWYAGI